MIVRAIADSLKDAPEEVFRVGHTRASVLHISKDKEYVVYAVSLFKGLLYYQIVDDTGIISWRLYCVFTVVDRALPPDWECNVFPGSVRLVMGPAFICESEAAYSAMVELEPDQVERFWQRVNGATVEAIVPPSSGGRDAADEQKSHDAASGSEH